MRVLVCGSRTWTDVGLLESTLDNLNGSILNYAEPGIDEVIEGCARGADRLAETWATKRGIPIRHTPAQWASRGRAAGPERNQRMLEQHPDLVVAFDLGTPGTGDMVSRAVKAGVRVQVVMPAEGLWL